MATTDPPKVPQTILSRTQRFDLKRLSITDIIEHLKNILNLEKIKFDNESLKLVATKADGSMRDSLSLLDQVISYSGDLVELDVVREILGVLRDSVYLELLQGIVQSDSNNIIENLNTIIESGYSISDFISGFNNFIRNCLLVSVGVNEISELGEDSIAWITSSDCILESTDLLRILDMSLEFESKLRNLQHPKVALESLFLKLSVMDTSISITQLLQGKTPISLKNTSSTTKISNVRKKPENTPETKVKRDEAIENKSKNVVSEGKKVELSKSVKQISIEDVQSKWHYLIGELEKVNTKTANFLDESEVTKMQNNILFITLKNRNGFEIKSLEKDSTILENILFKEFEVSLKVKYLSTAQKKTQKIQKSKPRNMEHPLFMKVIETLDGEIIR